MNSSATRRCTASAGLSSQCHDIYLDLSTGWQQLSLFPHPVIQTFSPARTRCLSEEIIGSVIYAPQLLELNPYSSSATESELAEFALSCRSAAHKRLLLRRGG